mgnify:CR=1 FL=1
MAYLTSMRTRRACRLCPRRAQGALAWPAIVDPWTRDVSAESIAASRRVLKTGDLLCRECAAGVSYDIGPTDDDVTEPAEDAWPA